MKFTIAQIADALINEGISKSHVARVIELLLIREQTKKILAITDRTEAFRKSLANQYRMSEEMYDASNQSVNNDQDEFDYSNSFDKLTIASRKFPHESGCHCNTCLSFNTID